MKKWTSMILVLLMVGALTGCGDHSAETGKPESEPTEQTQETENTVVDLNDFYQKLAKDYDWDDDYMGEIEGDILNEYYPGLADIPAKQFIAKTPVMGAEANEIVLMECENAEDAAAAAEILEGRIRYQVGDGEGPGGAWYPEAMEQWSHGQVITEGNYAFLAVSAKNQDDLAERIHALFA